MNPYQKLLNRKRTWTPVQTTAGKLVEGAEETIYRALAIRHMELPVGDFITDALKIVSSAPSASFPAVVCTGVQVRLRLSSF